MSLQLKKEDIVEVIPCEESAHSLIREEDDYFTEQGTRLCKSYQKVSWFDLIKSRL